MRTLTPLPCTSVQLALDNPVLKGNIYVEASTGPPSSTRSRVTHLHSFQLLQGVQNSPEERAVTFLGNKSEVDDACCPDEARVQELYHMGPAAVKVMRPQDENRFAALSNSCTCQVPKRLANHQGVASIHLGCKGSVR